MRGWRIRIAALMAAAGCMLCGCSNLQAERQRPEYTVCVVLKALNSHYWMDMRSGMEQAADKANIDLTLLYPESEEENKAQQDLIADALKSEPDLLMVAACDSLDTNWYVREAEERGVQLLMVDTGAIDSNVPYIGTDNQSVGRMAAEYLSKTLPKGASIVIMTGSRRQKSHIDRISAFQKNLDPSFRIEEIFYTDLSQYAGYNNIKSMGDRPFDAVFCGNAVVGLGVATAVVEMEREVQIIAMDTQDDALQALEDGTMTAFISQDGYTIGYQAIETAVAALESGEKPEDVLFDSELLTKVSEEVQ